MDLQYRSLSSRLGPQAITRSIRGGTTIDQTDTDQKTDHTTHAI